MTPDMISLLRAVADRSRRALEAPEPRGFNCGIARAAWQEDQNHGSRLPTGEIFGPTAAGRKRGQRTLKKLEEAGYIEVWRPGGVAIRAKVTDAGRVVVQHLDGAQESLCASPALEAEARNPLPVFSEGDADG